MKNSLIIKNLHAGIAAKQILKGVNITVKPGRIVALMGPNGSGKSTLANVLMGHPDYQVKQGQVFFNNKNILNLESWERARLGIFLAFQYPYEIPGLTVYHFLQNAVRIVQGKNFVQSSFDLKIKTVAKDLHLVDSFLDRGLNEGFSGGEKKRMEILQLNLLNPQIAILDETDSGLDIDALKLVADNIKDLVDHKLGVLVITHYQRLLNYLEPDEVHVMRQGKIIASGDKNLARKLEAKGYSWLKVKN